MKTFAYTIKDELGIHARPAGLMVKAVKGFSSEITIAKNGKTASAKKLMALMGLGVKCGDEIQITVEGADEDQAAAAVQEFRAANL